MEGPHVHESVFEVVGQLRFRRKVRAVVQNRRGDFLLIQPHGYEDAWTLVGGGIEVGESSEEAMARELREEVGLTRFVEFRQLQVRHSYCYSEKQRRKRNLDHDGQLAILFSVVVDDFASVVLQAEEVHRFAWVPLNALEAHVKVPEQLALLRAAHEEILQRPSLG